MFCLQQTSTQVLFVYKLQLLHVLTTKKEWTDYYTGRYRTQEIISYGSESYLFFIVFGMYRYNYSFADPHFTLKNIRIFAKNDLCLFLGLYKRTSRLHEKLLFKTQNFLIFFQCWAILHLLDPGDHNQCGSKWIRIRNTGYKLQRYQIKKEFYSFTFHR